MLSHDCKGVQGRKLCRFAACLHVKLRPDTSDEFRFAALHGKHASNKEQITCLHCFLINAERLRGCWKRYAKFVQPLLGASKDGYFLQTVYS
jgi:hypothetical protein